MIVQMWASAAVVNVATQLSWPSFPRKRESSLIFYNVQRFTR